MDKKKDKVCVSELLDSVPDYIEKVKCDVAPHSKPFKCAVGSCKNAYVNAAQHKQSHFKFHNFPVDPLLCLKWKTLCGLRPNVETSDLKVCSDHFLLNDYIRNYKEEFQNKDFKRTLKPDACPNRNLGNLQNAALHFQVAIAELEQELNKATANSTKLQKIVDDQEQLLCQKSTRIQRLKNYGRKKETHQEKSVLQDVVNKVFSQSQIELLKGKEKVYWSDDDMARAFTFRHIGNKKCYLYFKNELNYPLPALSAVQKWAAADV